MKACVLVPSSTARTCPPTEPSPRWTGRPRLDPSTVLFFCLGFGFFAVLLLAVDCCQYPELLAVSYNANEEAPNEPDGMVLVWNTQMRERPEYVFECQVRATAIEVVCLPLYKSFDIITPLCLQS